MNIIKLSAISSTNDYLKSMASLQNPDNFTVVTAEAQTQGRGQMGATWAVEAGKNLTFSILLTNLQTGPSGIFTLNAAVAVAIATTVSELGLTEISIKWPNDILAGNKKIGGILIENSFKSDGRLQSVIGIGLNVNQTDFTDLAKASSMAVMTGVYFDKETILMALLNKIKLYTDSLAERKIDVWKEYHKMLFKKDIPMPFEKEGRRFMGIIQRVTENGQLEVLLESEVIAHYGIKEVQLLY